MNNILKILLLNAIIFYFLIKDINYAIFIFILLILYLIYLKNNNLIEGNSKIKDLININNDLLNLIDIFKFAERNCIGGYTDYTSCDKKCGKSYKYSRYRIKQRAGIYGKECKEEYGFTKKELCTDESNIFQCKIGDPCEDNGDCESLNCDPYTNTCKFKEICSEQNLHLCDKSQCSNLNARYDTSNSNYTYENGICSKKDIKLNIKYDNINIPDVDLKSVVEK